MGEFKTSSEDKAWTLSTDGSSTSQAAGASVVLTSPEGFTIKQFVRFKFPTTNNEAEYEALISGLKLARHLEVSVIDIFSDSKLVVKQVLGEFKTLNERMTSNIQVVLRLLQMCTYWTISNINRANNHWVDTLSKFSTSSVKEYPSPIYIKEICQPSTIEREVNCVSSVNDYRLPILKFIQGTLVEEDKLKLRKLKFKAKHYYVIDNQL